MLPRGPFPVAPGVTLFQSSSGLSTGCCRAAVLAAPGFNPHPADATGKCEVSIAPSTSFNPHPAFRPDATPPTRCQGLVSILIDLSTMLPTSSLPIRFARMVFQSSSGLSAGWLKSRPPKGLPVNPHPAFRPDATRPMFSAFSIAVSILIRPFDRMLPVIDDDSGVNFPFQSSSGLSTGCYWPSPGPPGERFNPHPAFRPDATAMLGFPT